MDYLDPKKEFQHRVLLMVGYICIAIAVTMAALVLLYQAYGFGIGKNGTLIQNGLTFFSSQPNPANIYVDGKLANVRTNTRLVLPEGSHKIVLTRNGYRNWQREIQLNGGTVEHFDYPFLIPDKLDSKRVAGYDTAPPLATQSPDRRWLVVQHPDSALDFDVYDLKTPTKAGTPTPLSLPASLVGDAAAGTSWQLVDWADDNVHILLKHTDAQGGFEYILVDRTAPENSVNLTATQHITAPEVTLLNRKFDQYYLFDPADGTLQTAKLKDATITPLLEHVLAYKTYSDNTVLYATDNGAPKGKVLIKLQTGDQTFTLRSFDAGGPYLVDLTTYSGTLYVAAGSTSDNKVYIYKDPLGQLQSNPNQALVPSQVLHLTQPNYLSFSANAQYIVAENGQDFGVYDIENDNGYKFTAHQPLDAPQPHASWMDGNRLTYISGGKQLIFDYDYTNQQTLSSSLPADLPDFAPDYKYVYNLTSSAASSKIDLVQTALLAPADR